MYCIPSYWGFKISNGVPIATAATNVGCTFFTANWNAYTGAIYYLLDVSTDINFGSFVLQDQVVISNSFLVENLNQNTTYYYRVRASLSIDPDADAFLVAANLTSNATISSAINTLVLEMKQANIWSKMLAIYPIVGGTATTHKYNLKDPRDLDAAYRLLFSSGWTHSSSGMTPNGSTAYADTFMVPFSVNPILGNVSMGYYSRTNLTIGQHFDMGCSGNGEAYLCFTAGGSQFYAMHSGGSGYPRLSRTDGFLMFNRNNRNYGQIYFRQSLYRTQSSFGSAKPVYSVYIGALNRNGTPTDFTPRECAFAYFSQGLQNGEALTFQDIVQDFQTTLSRQV